MTNSFDADKLLSFIRSRRSIRQYQDREVPEEAIQQILEAGRWAPSASNRQPWHFIVIRDPDIRQSVSEHAAYAFIRWAHVGKAPVLIALCGNVKNRIYRQFLHEDVGIAGTQMMLQAAALGLGTCWVGGLDRKTIGDILKLPDSVELIGLLTLGYPDESPEPPPRKPLEQITHYEVFGNRKQGDAEAGRVITGPLSILLRKLRIKFNK